MNDTHDERNRDARYEQAQRHDPRPGQHFTVDESPEPERGDEHLTDSLRPAHTFDPQLPSRVLEDEEVPARSEAAIAESLARPRKRRWGLLTLLGGTLGVGAAELGETLYTSALGGDWLSGAWGLLGLLGVGLGGWALIRELWRLRRLKRHVSLRERLDALDTASPRGARRLAERLKQQLGLDDDHPHWQAFLQAHQPHHDGRETRTLLSHHLLAPRDREARRMISRMSGDTAIMVAISPLTLVDMLLVAWRNLAMVDRLARLYGLELGYASRLRLFRAVLYNMAFAGASEMASEASMELLSMNLAGRLSTRAGQGLGVGLLSARLGLRTLRLTRPLPFDEGEAPRIADLRRELWNRLRRLEQDPPRQ
ncbi:YcjF family protein [Litchfieldella xinjiangensis]|uniref:YcjF family protein n=1 Tax=Litchfieldella xinjiangensis TaxID=1166948 RepID=UPI000694C3E8|nr:TIGR01620 family protein [Halomonas xinjiangensis]